MSATVDAGADPGAAHSEGERVLALLAGAVPMPHCRSMVMSDKNFRFLTIAGLYWSSRHGTAALPLALTYTLMHIPSAR